jgi:uncharacterized protein
VSDLLELSESERKYLIDLINEIEVCPEVLEMKNYMQHGETSTYEHSLAVCMYSYAIACRLPFMCRSKRSLVYGAMLHDLFLYDWHNKGHRFHGFSHSGRALSNAKTYFRINEKEENIISSHMWPLTITKLPKCREAVIVCAVDKVCSTAEVFRVNYKELEKLENELDSENRTV